MTDKQSILQELHDQITQTTTPHLERQQALEAMQQHIQAALDSDEDHESLAQRLNEAIVQFENEHPALAATIRRAVSILSIGGV